MPFSVASRSTSPPKVRASIACTVACSRDAATRALARKALCSWTPAATRGCASCSRMARPHPSSARRSALTRRVIPESIDAGPSGIVAFFVRRVLPRGVAPRFPQPSGDAEQRQAERSPLSELPGRDALVVLRGQYLLVRLQFFGLGRFDRARAGAPIARRHPAGNEGERFGRACGTLRRVVHFFAVETQAGIPQLHVSSLAPSGPCDVSMTLARPSRLHETAFRVPD